MSVRVPNRPNDRTQRFEPWKVGYDLWYCEKFPLATLDQRRAWREPDDIPWIWGLLADIRAEGRLRNPILVWNHHDSPYLPRFCARHGGNRIWCAHILGWTHVPITCSARRADRDSRALLASHNARLISPSDLPAYFPDGGTVWCNDYGYGLYDVKRPEDTYAQYDAHPRSAAETEAPNTPTEARERTQNDRTSQPPASAPGLH